MLKAQASVSGSTLTSLRTLVELLPKHPISVKILDGSMNAASGLSGAKRRREAVVWEKAWERYEVWLIPKFSAR